MYPTPDREADLTNGEQWVVWLDLASEAEWALAELVALAALRVGNPSVPATVRPGGRDVP
jgi:hypothetical protein